MSGELEGRKELITFYVDSYQCINSKIVPNYLLIKTVHKLLELRSETNQKLSLPRHILQGSKLTPNRIHALVVQ